MSLLGKLIGGRYELLEKVGGGGMAIVYKARCHLLKRYVAVKILRLELVEDEEFVARFRRESQAAASLSHPNIVNIYDVGEEDGIYYIVMEYISGGTLKDYIREKGRLSPEEAINISLDICSAMAHAHQNKIIHRDIKPQNILMGEDGGVKVADFGIARAVTSATVTMAGNDVMGSVHYFSPEQARGGYVDEKSDLYSLGVVLYEMCTGTVPFNGNSAVSIALKHIQEDIIWPGNMDSDIPKSLRAIIGKALEKEQCMRYQSADEMIADLRRALVEPDGDFVVKNISSDMPTQAITPLKALETPKKVKDESAREDAQDKERKTKLSKRILTLIPVGILFIFLVFLGVSIYQNNFMYHEEEIPDIRGISMEDAKKLIEEKELTLNVIGRKNSKDVEEDHIISQEPAPNTNIKVPATIDVVISLGPKTTKVPDIVGKPEQEAVIELENRGLQVAGREYRDDDEYPRGTVISQSIQHGTEVLDNATIDLIISNGPAFSTVKVPSYVGLQLDIAKQTIARDNLKEGDIFEEYSDEVPKGVVIRHRPAEGVYVEKDRKIDLWVSRGKQPSYPKKLEIPLSGDGHSSKKKVAIKIERVNDESIVYNREHSVEEKIAVIDMEEEGIEDYNIYIDDHLKKRVTIDYTKKEGG